MTPKREAQMREAFERRLAEQAKQLLPEHMQDLLPDKIQEVLRRWPDGSYAWETVEKKWQEWLACARALEPMVRDGERYRFLRTDCIPPGVGTDQVLVVRKGFYDGRILVEENLDTAIDSAMSAALEDGNATE